MYTVRGLVLCRDTDAGIENLVVAAFDVDEGSQGRREVAGPIERRKEMAEVIESDRGSLETMGTRIGSVLTNGDGSFVLTSEDLRFEGVETRPDLLLVVYAPEDVQSARSPMPMPPQRRVLYASYVPRWNAGAEEAYVIRLTSEQLEEFGIGPTSSARKRLNAVIRLREGAMEAERHRERIREERLEIVKEEFEKRASRLVEAREVLKDFSGIPRSKRNDPCLVRHAEDLERAKQEAAKPALRRLRTMKLKFGLSLTIKEAKSLKLKMDENGRMSGEASTIDVAEMIHKVATSMTLQRGNNAPPATRLTMDELDRRYPDPSGEVRPAGDTKKSKGTRPQNRG